MSRLGKYILEKIDRLPESHKDSYADEVLDEFLKSGNAFAKVVGAKVGYCTTLKNRIQKRGITKVVVSIRRKEVYLIKK
jgi:rRNA-processing protein FCF1